MTTTTTVTFARSFQGRVNHLLDMDCAREGVKVTHCGLDAKPMARWTPSDARVDNKPRPICPRCRKAAGI